MADTQSVTRYTEAGDESADGYLVAHDDYAALERRLAAMRERAERAEAALVGARKLPTHAEVSTYRDTFRAELDKRMDTRHPSASPSTESHEVALRAFVKNRALKAPQ